MSKNKFYITTPIYYVNDKPHIGHAYTTILADVLCRYHKVEGDEVFFLTGLDEHGQKVQQAAEARKLSPQEHCDDLAPRFLQLWEKLEIQYDDFIRTTQKRHVTVVQDVLTRVYDAGDVYCDEYEGWYSVAEERFITETEKESGDFRDVKKLKERNWFFRMGKYQKRLLDHINDHPEFIQPVHRRNEVLGFLRQPLGDLCISRPKSRMGWGIELPFDKDYVTYVWFDALLNYITGPGFIADNKNFKKWWPASVHLIGKDILTTHAVYWPTMLFSLGLPLPKTIFAHGWWLTGDTKMSKSLGNIVNPLDLIDEYGIDSVRYYLMREMVLGQDANFTMESFIKRYNSDLANDFGNLLNRVSGLIGKNFDGVIPDAGQLTSDEDDIKGVSETLDLKVKELIGQMRLNEAIEETLQLVRRANKYLESQAPWKVAKTDLPRAGTVLYAATEALRISAAHLSPVMPFKSESVLDVLGALGTTPQWGGLKAGTKLKAHEALFPRLEIVKKP
ncbi:MAG: methionine--tRNA ligase [Candidatus Omnitrophica bacterium]|nr:methionine--tRNA ligase [Candidatus Omnitrophota bacterium]